MKTVKMPADRNRMQSTKPSASDSGRLGKELLGLLAIFCGLLVILSLATFDSRDPWLNHVVSGVVKIHNKAGLFGAYLGGLLYDIFGAASWVLPAFFCFGGARRILELAPLPWWRWTGFLFLGLCVCLAGASGDLGHVEIFARGVLPQGSGNVSSHGGGIIGHMLYVGLVGWMGATGTFLVWFFCLLMAFQMMTGISWLSLLIEGSRSLYASFCKKAQARMELLAASRKAKQAAKQQVSMPDERPSGPKPAPAAPAVIREDVPALAPAPAPAIEPPDSFAPDYSFNGMAGHDGAVGAAPEERTPAPFDVPPLLFGPGPDTSGGKESGLDLASDAFLSFSGVPDPQSDDGDRHGDARPGPSRLSFEQPALVHPALVHPALMHPHAEQPEEQRAVMKKAAGFFKSARKEKEEEGLPLWVRDFEEGRIGVPSDALFDRRSGISPMHPGDEAVNELIHGEAPRPVEAGLTKTPDQQAAMPRAENPASAIGMPPGLALEEKDEDLLTILWGKENAPEGMMTQSPSAPAPDAGGQSSPLAGVNGEVSLLSARTAAAVEALRGVGVTPPGTILYASSPKYADAALSEPGTDGTAVPLSGSGQHDTPEAQAPSAMTGVEQPVPPPEPCAPAGMAASDVHDEQTIPIFETPPVQAAAKPALMQAVIQRVKRIVPLPPLDLLEAAPPSKGATPRAALEEKGRNLMTCLKDFGILGELVGITPGPVVTMFEVRPAPGVRVSRIANLSDDIALALKAVAVRIQAPVPGTDTVGIEIPNAMRETVCLKEMLGSELFRQAKSLLTLALGKDIAGNPFIADLATMPHLLVAGATGAGKSVGINSIILSLIYKARPDQVKLLLMDPKRVEMAIYADLPHLVHPVVTEMQLAKNALEWAVSEMEQRYNAIARAGVRNISDYNAKFDSWKGNPPEGLEDLERMPYLVIIIDELADLMLVAAKEVETSIVRLAQLARAAGIHLILATQRPSVDVVTGLIKANFPCRISFQVTSKHDSRTILDTAGAEQLLGRGDMLFKPPGGKFRRMHGAFVNDKNVNAVVEYWKRQSKPEYHVDFSDWAPEGAATGVLGGNGGGGGDVAADPLYHESVEFVRQQGKASISLIQRKFRIGFNKAARYVEQMEQDGIIGPADGSKPRVVIR